MPHSIEEVLSGDLCEDIREETGIEYIEDFYNLKRPIYPFTSTSSKVDIYNFLSVEPDIKYLNIKSSNIPFFKFYLTKPAEFVTPEDEVVETVDAVKENQVAGVIEKSKSHGIHRNGHFISVNNSKSVKSVYKITDEGYRDAFLFSVSPDNKEKLSGPFVSIDSNYASFVSATLEHSPDLSQNLEHIRIIDDNALLINSPMYDVIGVIAELKLDFDDMIDMDDIEILNTID